MQSLLWIGSPFFAGELSACGWQNVALHNFEEPFLYGWEDLVRLAGFRPDVLVVADKSRPPFVLGVESFPCLTVFYSVDSHIHSWQPWYAQAFDLCLVSLRDHIASFAGTFLPPERIFWSPPFAQAHDQPDAAADKRWDCLFVGTVSADTPRRAAFLEALARHLPGLHVTRGNYRQLFPQGRILLNHCEHGDLNFRVFEAMGCGGCLLTPRVGHGLNELFREGEHLACYTPDDVEDAVRTIRTLLAQKELTARMGQAACAAIDAGHRAIDRARAFSAHLHALGREEARSLIRARLQRAASIHERCLKLPYLLWADAVGNSGQRAGYLAAAQADIPPHTYTDPVGARRIYGVYPS